MWGCLAFLIASILGRAAEAYVPRSMPIKWIKSGKELVLMPNGVVPRTKLATPQTLRIMDPRDNVSPSIMPRFTVNHDETITFDDVGWCIEGDQNSNTVRVNWCTGGPEQKWNWIPDGRGKYMVRLKGAHACLGVTDVFHGFVGLRACEDQAKESWKFEEVMPHARQNSSKTLGLSSSLRHIMMAMFGVAAITLLSLGLRSRQWRITAKRERRGLDLVSVGVDGQSGVAMAPPLALGQAVASVGHEAPSSTPLFVPQVFASVGAEIEKAPTSPGPQLQRQGGGGGAGGGSSGGGGGGDGGSHLCLRTISAEEQAIIINDWAAKSMVYRMSGSFGGSQAFGQMHSKQVERLEKLRKFDKSPYVMKGLFENAPELQEGRIVDADQTQKVRAILGAEIHGPSESFIVEHVALCPSVLNDGESTSHWFKLILTGMAFQVKQDPSCGLDLGPLSRDPYYDGMEKDLPLLQRQGGGGGSSGGGVRIMVDPSTTFVRRISAEELEIIINDWAAKSKVFLRNISTGQPEMFVNDWGAISMKLSREKYFREMHSRQVERLEKFRKFDKYPYGMMGIFENAPELHQGRIVDADQTQKLWAIVGVEIQETTGKWIVEHMALYPSVLNNVESTTNLFKDTLSYVVKMAKIAGADLDVFPLLRDPYGTVLR